MRIVYFFYYLKQTPKESLLNMLRFAGNDKVRLSMLIDMIVSSFKYKISFMDFLYFKFYDKDKNEREKWAGTGFMYEYQLKMNPKSERWILEDKIKFLDSYKDFIERDWVSLDRLEDNKSIVNIILQNESGKIVVKGSKGQVGAEVQVLDAGGYSIDSLKEYMIANNYDLLEEAVVQHDDLMKLSPSGLNTVRIITQLNKDNEIDILGARLRVSVNSAVDNLAAGNFAAAVDIDSGIVISDGIFSDITKSDIIEHPITKVKIKGFSIPNWDMAVEIAKNAALLHPQNKSIGWDIAIKNDSVELIEGNHNWCKSLFQLPVKKGLKQVLTQYL